jgi:hypothetical protein
MEKNRIKVVDKAIVIVSALVIGLLAIYFLTQKKAFDGTWRNSFVYGFMFLFSLVTFLVYFIKYQKQKEWNHLSFEERCKRDAEEAKEKEKSWFLYQKNPRDSKYRALLLSPKDIVNKGGDMYNLSDSEEVREFLAKGEIVNSHKTAITLKYC